MSLLTAEKLCLERRFANGLLDYDFLDDEFVTDDDEECEEGEEGELLEDCEDGMLLENGFEDFEDFGIDKEEVAEYYFNMFKQEFPEIVRETNLTKEELVSCSLCPDLFHYQKHL